MQALATHYQSVKPHPAQVFGAFLFLFIVLVAICAPLIAPVDSSSSPFNLDLGAVNLKPLEGNHILGTDSLGRDLFGLAAWGARASLLVGIFSAIAAVTIGSIWGATSALAGGWVEALLMRIVDVLLAIPSIILLLVIDALLADLPYKSFMPKFALDFLGITNYSEGILPIFVVVIVVSATTWLEAARLTRARVQSILQEEYVAAAFALGLDNWSIITKHLLPNAANIILVEATLLVSDAILIEAGLSFLGLGLGPSTPSWGGMLNNAQANLLQGNWWSVVVPGTLIAITVLSIQLITQETN
jgi:peptide/nickel transport system permease protein